MRPRNLAARSAVLLAGCILAASTALPVHLQQQAPQAEFQRLASQIAAARLAGGAEDAQAFERALSLLDLQVLNGLRASPGPDLPAINRSLAALIAENGPVSQSFLLGRLEGTMPVYVLVANFGLAGPSAIRIYSSGEAGFSLAARIDRLTQKNFFDEYLALVPVAASDPVFVTVTGRTDELQTGSFAAWRIRGQSVELLWSADLLQQSEYEVSADGFRLTYCAEPEDGNLQQCRRMTRDRFLWEAGSWKRVQQTPVAVPKR